MFRNSVVISVLLLSLVLSAAGSSMAVGAEPLAPAIKWIPNDALLVVELTNPEAFIEAVLCPEAVSAVTSNAAYKHLTSQDGYKQFEQGLRMIEASLGTDWQNAIKQLLAGGVTFAVRPDESVSLIVDSADAEMLGKLQEILLNLARAEAVKQGNPGAVKSSEYGGITGWTLGGDDVHCIVNNRLLMSNKPAALKAMLDLREGSGGQTIADSPAYKQAKADLGSKPVASVFVNLKSIKSEPSIAAALNQGPDPVASLLIPGVTEALRESNWAAVGLSVDGYKLGLEATLDGKMAGKDGPASYAWSDKPDGGALPNISVPRQIAGMTFYRDLQTFYAAKDELFPQRTAGLIFFENMMGIFFTGRDLTDEVLAELEPEVRFVVAEQKYDSETGKPALQLPSFAAIFRMDNPDYFSEVMEEAWQKALGLINFTSGQQAQPGLILYRPAHNGVTFSVSRYSTADIDENAEVHSRYNFRPSLATFDEWLVISSTESLARDLIDALKAETAKQPKALAGVHSMVEVNGRQLVSILKANRANLVRQNMIDDGHTKEEAEAAIGVILSIAEYFGGAKIELGSEDGRMRAKLELEVNLGE
ncbi:MAG: DUF3352 domain-containing protein [Pirellulaceae bacterium]|nr:DUF3352 domain-containing protein [Pirellulaceae bacterium]